MAERLPYRAKTASGEIIDAVFPLHPDTGSPVRVAQIISAVLQAVDRDVGLEGSSQGETSNGDVLQGLAMALAIRSAMIHAPAPVTGGLALELVEKALAAAAEADRQSPPSGRA